MKHILLCILSLGISAISLAQSAQQNKYPDFIGKTFDYTIENYHLNLKILSDTQAQWTYVAAPNNETGKTEIENVHIATIAPGIYQIYWAEKDGAHVVDIFNLSTHQVFVNYTLQDATMYHFQSAFKIIP